MKEGGAPKSLIKHEQMEHDQMGKMAKKERHPQSHDEFMKLGE